MNEVTNKYMKGIQDILLSAGNYGCLALDYAYIVEACSKEFNPEVFASKVQLFLDILDAQNNDLLEEDFFVKDAQKYMQYLDPSKQYSVFKKDITSMIDLKGTMGCVRFDYNGHSHWVVYADGQIVFDPLANSQCRLKGKPTTARVVEIKELK